MDAVVAMNSIGTNCPGPTKHGRRLGIKSALLALAACLLCLQPASADEAAKRGGYLFRVAGCAGCHTNVASGGQPLAVGRPLATPFGTFYGPNITPDPEHGIGRWTRADFRRALRDGLAPDGSPYYPAFPYTSFTQLADADIDDLWSFIRTVPAVNNRNRGHDLKFPFNFRFLIWIWRWLFFNLGPFEPDRARNDNLNRGAYLVEAVGHCGECHSPRGLLGQVDRDRAYAGNPQGPEGKRVPNITPHEVDGIGKWSVDDLDTYLSLGMTPTGDFAGDAMAEVVRASTQYLSVNDRQALARYLKSVPARPKVP